MPNDILQYTSRDYNSIKTDLINSISSLTNLWTSREDGDPGIVLVKLMSALGDMLSFNFDKQALEYYGPTVTQRKNASRLFELIGYKMHWYKAAVTNVSLTYKPSVPDFISFYKRIVDGENAVDVYYDYRDYYVCDFDSTTTSYKISLPPITNGSGQIPLIDGMNERDTILNIQNEISDWQQGQDVRVTPSVKENDTFIANANTFAGYAKEVYSLWQKANRIGIHTYIEDPQISLLLYSSTYAEPAYSLIPVEEASIDSTTGTYMPTLYLLPYETTQQKAIQGSMCSVNFTSRQLKKNCFYLPDSNVDQDYLFLGYKTSNSNITDQPTIFIDKVDNLLTESDGKLHFQFGVDEFDYPYIELSSYWVDTLGDQAVTFTLYYFRTQGKFGNITENYLKRLNGTQSGNIDVTNMENTDYHVDNFGNTICAPGYNPETAPEAYKNSLNYVMTYDTIVTIYDFMRFTKRQDGISNAFACDGQYAKDLNDKQLELCQSYTREQLINILGTDVGGATTDQLAQYLFNIRKIMPNYKNNIVTISQAQTPPSVPDFINYSINIYPIVNDYDTSQDNEQGISFEIAKFSNDPGVGLEYPYKVYRIITSEDDGMTPDNYKIETQLDEAFEEVHVANVKPFYNGCRVFDWRVCGTLHLKKAVTPEEADDIIRTVINTIASVYSVGNVQFGEKVNYMELIDVIVSSHNNIRYFDAGMGNKKLIEFENPVDPEHRNEYFIPEAYFNDESIMRYAQSADECLGDPTSNYYKYITIDPTYIIKSNDPSNTNT
jgi:hypothetical protein